LIESLIRAKRELEFDLWAYVIMPEHVHLLICPRDDRYDISQILKAIKKPVAQIAIQYLKGEAPAFLAKLRISPANSLARHAFCQPGGGYDRNIENPKLARNIVDYIHANPVRRGLVTAEIDWRWSSARWYAGHSDIVLEMDVPPAAIAAI